MTAYNDVAVEPLVTTQQGLPTLYDIKHSNVMQMICTQYVWFYVFLSNTENFYLIILGDWKVTPI